MLKVFFLIYFKIKDSNKNGRLDGHEIERVIKGLHKDCEDVEEIMNWDKNNSGSLSEDEFIDFVLENPVLKKYFIDLIK